MADAPPSRELAPLFRDIPDILNDYRLRVGNDLLILGRRKTFLVT